MLNKIIYVASWMGLVLFIAGIVFLVSQGWHEPYTPKADPT